MDIFTDDIYSERIEYWRQQGLSDAQILERVESQIRLVNAAMLAVEDSKFSR